MARSLSSLADNFTGEPHRGKSKSYKSDLEYITINDSSFVFKCVDCNTNYEKEFDENLARTFMNT